jgi:hypothetical protein
MSELGNLWLKFEDIMMEDEKWFDGVTLHCHQHGLLESWSYAYPVPLNAITRIAEEHNELMHFG